MADLTPDALTSPDELRALRDLAALVPRGQAAVELGVFRGGSLRAICEGAREGVRVFGVDTFGGVGTPEYYREGSDWLGWWSRLAGRQHSWKEDLRAAEAAAPSATIIVGDTAETGVRWWGPRVALLYVDADHSYEGVRDDWIAWSPRLASSGACVIFDDYMYRVRGKDHYPGVTRFVDELGLPVERIGKAALVRL